MNWATIVGLVLIATTAATGVAVVAFGFGGSSQTSPFVYYVPSSPTATATPTTAPGHGGCVSFFARQRLMVGVLRRLGTRAGQRHYDAQYDLNGDGKIDSRDLRIALTSPACGSRRHG